MSRTCPSCGYRPIGPYTDNCPICAEPVRNVRSGDGDGGGPLNLSPSLIGGWVVVAVVLGVFLWGEWPLLLLNVGLCGTAWWAVVRGETLLVRLLGASLLVMFIPALFLAHSTILPGLDRREPSPQRFLNEMMAVLQGTSPETLQMRARMKTVSVIIYASYAAIVLPLALVVPPLLSSRRRHQLGGPIYLSRAPALGVLLAWVLLLPLLGWLAWPTMQSWAEAPGKQIQWPQGQWPAVSPDGQEGP